MEFFINDSLFSFSSFNNALIYGREDFSILCVLYFIVLYFFGLLVFFHGTIGCNFLGNRAVARSCPSLGRHVYQPTLQLMVAGAVITHHKTVITDHKVVFITSTWIECLKNKTNAVLSFCQGKF